jgi:hypothetical protein
MDSALFWESKISIQIENIKQTKNLPGKHKFRTANIHLKNNCGSGRRGENRRDSSQHPLRISARRRTKIYRRRHHPDELKKLRDVFPFFSFVPDLDVVLGFSQL